MSSKRLIAITFVFLMITAMIIPLIKADVTGITLTSPTSPVHISQAGGTVAVEFIVTVDRTDYTYDVQVNSNAAGGNVNLNNQHCTTGTYSYVKTATLNIPAGATPGTYTIEVKGKQYPNQGGNDIEKTFTGMIIVDPATPQDTTPPVTTIDVTGTSGIGGWYVATPVTFTLSAADNTGGSGINAIYYNLNGGATQAYTGSVSISAQGSTTISYWAADKAGNIEGVKSKTIQIDSIAPITGQPTFTGTQGDNGWYKSTVTVEFAAPPSDLTPGSGLQGTYYDIGSGTQTYTSAFTLSDGVTTLTYWSKDNAGNVEATQTAQTIKVDTIKPSLILTAARDPNAAGWYNAPLDFAISASDSGSGIASQTPSGAQITYNGPDSNIASVTVSVTDSAGNTQAQTVTFKYDATSPTVTLTPDRAPNSAGWYNAPVTWAVGASDATSGVASKSAETVSYSTPETATETRVSATATDEAGNVGVGYSSYFKYDSVAPAVTLTADRAPDSNGWYNHTVTWTVNALDANSGVLSKDSNPSYSGPDIANGQIDASATDTAGNIGTGSANFKYDATAPTITSPNDGQSYILGQSVTPSWTANDALSGLDSSSASVTALDTSSVGPKTFDITAIDIAGNSVTKTVHYSVIYSAAFGHKILAPLQQVNAASELTKSYKSGSTLPIKFQLCNYAGTPVGPAAKLPTLSTTFIGTATDPADTAISVDASGAANTGNVFRFDNTVMQYIYNLNTKGYALGTYRITVSLDDGSSIVTYFELKK